MVCYYFLQVGGFGAKNMIEKIPVEAIYGKLIIRRKICGLLKCQILHLIAFFISLLQDRARSARWISGKALRTIVEEYTDLNAFKKLVQPILIPRMPDTEGNTRVRNVSVVKRGWM